MITVTDKARAALLADKPDDCEKVTLRFFIEMEGG